MSRAPTADPVHEGVQLLATDDGEDAGFATIFWSCETTSPGRIGVMNDLFRDPGIPRARRQLRAHSRLRRTLPGSRGGPDGVQTAADNLAAQAVYEHVGATRETWIDYRLDTAV